MKIVVLAGGLSPERDVSLSSGSLIANALMETGHDVMIQDVYMNVSADASNFEDLFSSKKDHKTFTYAISAQEPDLDSVRAYNNQRRAAIGEKVLDLCAYADLVFVALHGAMGENGSLQATFDNYGIRYTGTGFAGSLLAMDKDITKRLLVQAGLPTAQWLLYNVCDGNRDSIYRTIGFPCVVKPCGCGSSVGVSIVHGRGELDSAITYAAKYEKILLIEKMIAGREFSVGILDGAALPVIEIIPNAGFYDYENKYQSGRTQEICPAKLTPVETKRVQELALAVHKTLRLGDYSRIDFIEDSSGEFICLEANTLPGMTPNSLLPQEAACVCISYPRLCETIAELAMKHE